MHMKPTNGLLNQGRDAWVHRKGHIWNLRSSSLQMSLIGVCLGITIAVTLVRFGESELNCQPLGIQSAVSPTFDNNLKPITSVTANLNQKVSGTSSKAPNENQQAVFRRPRFFYTELGLRKKLFAAVVIHESVQLDLLVAFNRTAGTDFEKLVIFVGGGSKSEETIKSLGDKGFHGIINVSSKNRSRLVDNSGSYGKSTDGGKDETVVRVLSYLNDKFSESYDYFYLVSSGTFVNAKRVVEIANQISIQHDVVLGSPIGNHCDLDYGYILSRKVLQQVAPKASHCYQHIALNLHHHFTKCMDMMFASHPCTESFQDTGYSTEKPETWKDAVEAVPSISDENVFYNHQKKVVASLCEQTLAKIQRIRKKIEALVPKLPADHQQALWPTGLPGPFAPQSRFDIRKWEFVRGDQIFGTSETSVASSIRGTDQQDLAHLLKSSTAFLQTQTNASNKVLELQQVYRRYDPTRGMEYLLDFTNLANKRNMRIQALRPLSKMELVPVPFVTETRKVFIVVPIMFQPLEEIRQFLNSYFDMRSSRKENTALIFLILIPGDTDVPAVETRTLRPEEIDEIKAMIFRCNAKAVKNGTETVKAGYILVPKRNTKFSSPYLTGIDSVINRIVGKSALILAADLRVSFDDEFLNRVRINTIEKWQVFSPIPFREYNPKIYDSKSGLSYSFAKKLDVSKNTGRFDAQNHQYFSFIAGDYLEARKASASNYKLLDKLSRIHSYEVLETLFLSSSHLHIFRAVEPKLKIPFKKADVSDLSVCMKAACGTKAQLYHLFADVDPPSV